MGSSGVLRPVRRAATVLLALAAAALTGLSAQEARAAEPTLLAQVTTEDCAPESERCASESCAEAEGGCGSGGGGGGGPREEPPQDPPEEPSPTDGGVGADDSGNADGRAERAALSEPQEFEPGAASSAGGGSAEELPFTGLGLGALVAAGLALVTVGLLAVRRARTGRRA